MINFKVSAPGNLILFGEHMMMYEKYVVSASLDLRTTLKFYYLNKSSNMIKVEFPDVNLSLNLSLELILNFFFGNEHTNSVLDNILLLKQVQYFITSNGMWTTYEQKFSLQTFFFLLIYIAHKERLNIKSFHVHLTTQLPMKAGLGSSTSFAVCLAACFVHWKRLQKGYNAFNAEHNEFSKQELKRISNYANCCEEVVQNYMFETYSEVCTYGKIFRYRYKMKEGYNIRFLTVPNWKILLIDAGIRQNKYKQMEKMAKNIYYSATFINNILISISKLSRMASSKLDSIYQIQRNYFRKLQEIYLALSIDIQLNQELLCELGLSHPNLNKICTIAKTNKLPGKLTGLGGYAYILLPPDVSFEFVAFISAQIMAEGFTVIMTSVSCNGVRIDD